MKIILATLLLASTGCATATAKHPIEIVRACTTEQLDLCGDIICEGDEVFELIIARMGSAIEYCFEEPDSIDEKYYDAKVRKEVYIKYNVEHVIKGEE